MTLLTAPAPLAHGPGQNPTNFLENQRFHAGAQHHNLPSEARELARQARPADGLEKAGGEMAARRFMPQSAAEFADDVKATIGKALRTLGRDLGKLLADMGFSPDAARDVAKGLIDPVRQALKQGADFTAEISLVALRQDTLVSNGSFAQNTQIVAKSLEIEVNHTTGEFAISMQSLSIEQSTLAVGRGVTLETVPQGLDLGDAGLSQFIQRLLDGDTADDVEDGADKTPEQSGLQARLLDQLDEVADGDGSDFAPDDTNHRLDQPMRQAVHDGETRFAIRAVERFENLAGHLITRLRLDAATPLHEQLQNSLDAGAARSPRLDLQV